MSVQGICELCRSSGDILKSHLELPKFVFKRLRAEAAKNPHPVQISADGVRQTQNQQRLPLLCSRCENDRFNSLGERWVAGACLQTDESFPLKDLVLSAPYESNGIDAKCFLTDKVAGLNHAAIEYFAASMVWRAQFLPRNPISLGESDAHFRAYLLGIQEFPTEATLVVGIRYRSNLTQASHHVIEGKGVDGSPSFTFYIPGMFFKVVLEKPHNPSVLRLACFVHAPHRLILDADVIDKDLSERITQVTLAARDSGKRWRITEDSIPHYLLKK